MFAEESTAWGGVSRPPDTGGLGFGFKWDLGWMHDTLEYIRKEPVHRRWHHDNLTFRSVYAESENFVLPLSHDEVVHGKGALLGKMPGDAWQKRANLRLLYGYQWTLPGKKLLFMGGELGTWREWNHDDELDWGILGDAGHAGLSRWLGDLNAVYRATPALYRRDVTPGGFKWLVGDDRDSSVLAYLRLGDAGDHPALIACNFTPEPRAPYRLGVPVGGPWREALNSDAGIYGGSNLGNLGGVVAEPSLACRGEVYGLELMLPPLACVVLVSEHVP
jgi:1,4-alpha-glucan branching enzyme